MTWVGHGDRIVKLDTEIKAKLFNEDYKNQQAWKYTNKKMYWYQGGFGLNNVH